MRRLTCELDGLKALKRKLEPQLKEKQAALNDALGELEAARIDHAKALTAKDEEIRLLKEQLAESERAAIREREQGFRSFPMSETGRTLEREFRARLLSRFEVSGAFLKAASDIATDYLDNCLGVVAGDLATKGIDHSINTDDVVERAPEDIPSFKGDPEEDPDLDWWKGLWEEAVATTIPPAPLN